MNLEKLFNSLAEMGATYGLRILGVLFALYISFKIGGWVKNKVIASLEARKFDATLTRFFGNLARYGVIVGAVLGCLGVFGIETTSFAAVIGAAGLAIGLAFQGTLSNFSAGIMLLIFRPYSVGDVVTVNGKTGKVKELELFTTELVTPDNRRLIVPNGKIFGSTIENITHHDTRRVDVAVGVDYSADIDEVKEILDAAVPGIPGVLEDPGHQIFLKELGGSSVDWQVRVWCNTADYWDVYQATIRAIKMALDAKGVGIPYPQMDVHLDPDVSKGLSKSA